MTVSSASVTLMISRPRPSFDPTFDRPAPPHHRRGHALSRSIVVSSHALCVVYNQAHEDPRRYITTVYGLVTHPSLPSYFYCSLSSHFYLHNHFTTDPRHQRTISSTMNTPKKQTSANGVSASHKYILHERLTMVRDFPLGPPPASRLLLRRRPRLPVRRLLARGRQAVARRLKGESLCTEHRISIRLRHP